MMCPARIKAIRFLDWVQDDIVAKRVLLQPVTMAMRKD